MFTRVKSIAPSSPDACPLVTRSLSDDCPLSARSSLTVRADQVHASGCTATMRNKSQLYLRLWHTSAFGVLPHLSEFLLLSSPSLPTISRQVNPSYTYTTGHRKCINNCFYVIYLLCYNEKL